MMHTTYHVHIGFCLQAVAPTRTPEAMKLSVNTTDIDKALLTLWDYLFTRSEQRYERAGKHGVELFDPTCQLGNVTWPHITSINFVAAPSPTTFVFAVTFADNNAAPEALFTVAKEGDVFRVLDLPPYIS